jgi:hypothetical protein
MSEETYFSEDAKPKLVLAGEPEPAEHLHGFDQPQPEAAPPQAPQFPMLQIPLTGANIQIVRGEDGERLMVVGPVLVQFGLPFDSEAARALGRELTGGVEIASSLPSGLVRV